MPCLWFPCSSGNPNRTLPKSFIDPNPNPNPNPPEPFASLLRDSADRFIADYRDSVTDFSKFTSVFWRLIHTVPDPPVLVFWFYSAVLFHGAKLAAAPGDRVSAVKDLFQLLVSCSARGGASERIAALAPVVVELRDLALEMRQCDGGGEEVQRLSEGLVSYLSICCAEAPESDSGDLSLGSCFSDVVRVWMVDRSAVGEELKAFFPIAGDDVIATVRTEAESCRVGYVAGVVMFEAFVLRLCLRFGMEGSRAELEKDLRNCAQQMISRGFRSFSFLDTLLKTLLEPVLPVPNLLKSKDATFLQEVLFDSVIMADYSFFKPQLGILVQSERLKNLAVTWLLFCHKAIQLIRKSDDQSKVTSCMTAFSESCLTSHLIKWIADRIDSLGNSVPNFATPVAIIRWMLLAEEQGARMFDSEISKVRAKRVICDSRVECVLPLHVAQPNEENLDGGDLEMVDSPTINGQRKRKGIMLEEEIQFKFVKSRVCEKSASERFPSLGRDGALRCENKVKNQVFEREMVDMEQ